MPISAAHRSDATQFRKLPIGNIDTLGKKVRAGKGKIPDADKLDPLEEAPPSGEYQPFAPSCQWRTCDLISRRLSVV